MSPASRSSVSGAALCLVLVVSCQALGSSHNLHLAVAGAIMDYLEPCGCGGQNAGGLARRAAMIAEQRCIWPDLALLDLGDLGQDPLRLPVITRSLAALGADALALGTSDLDRWEKLSPALTAAALAATSVVPLVGNEPPLAVPPRSLTVGPPRGPQLGVVSVAWGAWTRAQMVEATRAELDRLRQAHIEHLALAAHLSRADAERLLDALGDASQPDLLLLATDDNFPRPVFVRGRVTWVPVAHKGRSLSLITLRADGPPQVEQQLVGDGPRDPVVQGWVDAWFRDVKAGETRPATTTVASFPRVAACLPCHEPVVKAWRAHGHSRAVETLVARGRDVAGCLRCHDERLRRDGLRSEPGDRAVECASCHDGLTEHVAGKGQATKPDAARCETCHVAEHSPRWRYQDYLPTVARACRGVR